MNSKARDILVVSTLLVVGLYFLVMGMTSAASFFKPLILSLIIAMVLVPMVRKMEGWGMHRALSSLVAVVVSMLAVAVILGLFAVQINKVAEDWPDIKENLKPAVEEVHQFVERTSGLSKKEQIAFLERNVPLSSSSEEGGESEPQEKATSERDRKAQTGTVSSNTVGMVGKAMMNIFSFLGTFLLVFIYIFFILFYRRKIKNSILKFFDETHRKNAEKVLVQSVKLSENYLLGRLILITFLGIIYSIGLSSFGVRNAIFVSLFAAVLTLIPYVGNIVGFVLATAMAAFSGGDIWTFVGVAITFSVAQFVESYILEPYVVGDKVDLNPLATILVVIVGGAVWGIMGMIVSIPLFGILKIVFDNIPATEPLGYALGDEDVGSDEPGKLEKLADRIRKKFKSD